MNEEMNEKTNTTDYYLSRILHELRKLNNKLDTYTAVSPRRTVSDPLSEMGFKRSFEVGDILKIGGYYWVVIGKSMTNELRLISKEVIWRRVRSVMIDLYLRVNSNSVFSYKEINCFGITQLFLPTVDDLTAIKEAGCDDEDDYWIFDERFYKGGKIVYAVKGEYHGIRPILIIDEDRLNSI